MPGYNTLRYFFEMPEVDCPALIDRSRYPLNEPPNRELAGVIRSVRKELNTDGCAVIRGFFSGTGLSALRTEAIDRAGLAHYSDSKACNVYLGEANPARAESHPQNVFLPRTNGFVPADAFGPETVSRQLYAWPPLTSFIARCLDRQELFVYEDPVSNMIVNVCRPGQEFNWHFDTNEFTITMLLQSAESGGHFEYVPNLRRPDSECYRDVKRVLDGDRTRVKTLDLEAGDLQLFLGRFSLHRVTRNTGKRDRLLLIMSFAEKPGMVGNPYRVKDLYGKTTSAHDQASGQRIRADALLD